MKGKHFSPKVNKSSKRTRNIILSIVAVLELILLITSMTFSWFEGLTSLEMKGENIHTAAPLNSHITLGETIDGDENNNFDQVIDLTTFFDAQREVRLSPVSSSDNENFYAVYKGTPGEATTTYRKLMPEDVNANIIRFEFTISSPDGPADVYLSQLVPKVKINNVEKTGADVSPYRIAFSDGDVTRILSASALDDSVGKYSSLKTITSLNSDNTAKTTTGKIENYQKYHYNTKHTSKTPLFSIESGERKVITCSLWIDALDPDYAKCVNPGDTVSFDVKLCTSWSISKSITVYDYTADQTIDDDSNTRALYVANADGLYGSTYDYRRHYELTYNAETKCWSGSIPIGLKNCELIWRRKDNTGERKTWNAPAKGDSTIITLLGSTECVWDLQPSDLILISFSDYTNGSRISTDAKGNTVDMSARIAYDGRLLRYNMTSTPVNTGGKNTWYCWIPASVQSVDFFASGYNSSNVYTDLSYWIGSDRGDETLYRASIESDSSFGNDTLYIFYLSVNSNQVDKFYGGKYEPSISYTNENNLGFVSNTSVRTDYNPSLDKWPTNGRPLTKVEGQDNLYYLAFESQPTTEQYITVWNRSQIQHATSLPSGASYGITYSGNTAATFDWNSYDTLYVNSTLEINSESYYLYCVSTGTAEKFVGTRVGSHEEGLWGESKLPTGSYTTYFVPMNATDSVSVAYSYQETVDGVVSTYNVTVPMIKGDDGIWYTDNIHDDATDIVFTDSNGMQWQSQTTEIYGGRSSVANYYYPYKNTTSSKITGAGTFCSKLTGNTVNFKHFDSSVTHMYARFTYAISVNGTTKSGSMYVPLTKGSDNLTWSTSCIPSNITTIRFCDATTTTRYWNTTAGRSTTGESTAYAVNKNTNAKSVQWKTGDNQSKWVRIYFTNNYSWSSRYIYYWDGFESNTWPGTSMTRICTNDQSQNVFFALVPAGSKIIFNNGNNAGSQTANITTNVVDMKGFYLTGDSGTNMATGTWDVTASHLYSYSVNIAIPTN